MIRLLMADDDAIVRSSLRSELATARDIDVVGEADNSQTTVELIAELQPDVVLLDVALPPLPITTLIAGLRSAISPPPDVIMLGFESKLSTVLDVLQAGASGYFLRCDALSLLVPTIRAVRSGVLSFSPKVKQRWNEERAERVEPARLTSSGEALSKRERDVLRWMAFGLSNREIAEKLMISPATIKNHITSIYGKLHVHSPREAIAWAWMSGLVQLAKE